MEAGSKVKKSSVTGLTPTQEKACNLLASGVNAVEVAQELSISEHTLYLWQKQSTFECYYNRQRSVIKAAAEQCLFGLLNEAVAAIRESLMCTNEAVRLKAAIYIVDKLQKSQIGQTDITEIARAEATHGDPDSTWGGSFFHEKEYKKRLKEYGVEAQDYDSTLK